MRKVVALSVGLAALGGCALVSDDDRQAVGFRSEPPGASVLTSTGATCPRTPCFIAMPRGRAFTATMSLPGYRDATVAIGVRRVATERLGGYLGSGPEVDSFDPNPVTGRLEPTARRR